MWLQALRHPPCPRCRDATARDPLLAAKCPQQPPAQALGRGFLVTTPCQVLPPAHEHSSGAAPGAPCGCRGTGLGPGIGLGLGIWLGMETEMPQAGLTAPAQPQGLDAGRRN